MRKMRLIKIFVLLAGILSILEALSRIGLWHFYHIDAFHQKKIEQIFYQRLKSIHAINQGPEYNRILLLGSSPILPSNHDFHKNLTNQLGDSKIIVENLARSGYTSRHLYNQFSLIDSQIFDLVIYYGLANDLRTDFTSKFRFSKTYNHYQDLWAQNLYCKSPATFELVTFPIVLPLIVYETLPWKLKSKILLTGKQPGYLSGEIHNKYAAELKSLPAYETNLEQIILHAQKGGTKILLLDFCYHIPANYSLRRFQQGKLSFDKSAMPIEGYSTPAVFETAVKKQREIIQSLASKFPGISVENICPDTLNARQYWRDPMHFSGIGTEVFTSKLATKIFAGLNLDNSGRTAQDEF